MKRDLYKKLLEWKNSPRRKPLILQGARQVGKTYLLELFGKQEFSNYIYLNFEQDKELKKFFQKSLKPNAILENIRIYTEQLIEPGNTLILFDEIQECPEALNSLKYFQEEASEFHIAAAGSLLGVKLANTAGFPVGKVNFLHLAPFSFCEFLTAIEKNKLRDHLENIKEIEPIFEAFHNDLLSLLKKYMLIGGMPEAIATYLDSNDLLAVRNVQKEILKAYDLDFIKHAPKAEIMRISQVWQSIPKQLAKENSKFIFSVIRDGARGREYENAVQWLFEAGLIIKSYNITAAKLPLPAYGDTNAFKVFMLDVGLLAAMCDIPIKVIVAENELFSEFNGAFTENYVAQAIGPIQDPLYYWTSEGIAEVDFILRHEAKVYPLEVKSGESRRKKSLLVYDQKFKPELLLRASTMNLKLDGKILNFPLYMVGILGQYLPY
jgi:Predicted ATPase (AAA+ superfamily)